MSQQVAIKNFCIANRNASKRLDYIITAGQWPAVVHVPPHVLEGDALLCTIRPHKCCKFLQSRSFVQASQATMTRQKIVCWAFRRLSAGG